MATATKRKRSKARPRKRTCEATLEVVFPAYLTPAGSCTQPGATPTNPKDHLMFRVRDASGICKDAGVFDTVRFVDADDGVVLADARHELDSDWHSM